MVLSEIRKGLEDLDKNLPVLHFLPCYDAMFNLIKQGLSVHDIFITKKIYMFFSELKACDRAALEQLNNYQDKELVGEHIMFFIENCESSEKAKFIAYLLNSVSLYANSNEKASLSIEEYLKLSFNLSKVYFKNLKQLLEHKQVKYYTSNDILDENTITTLYNAGILEHLGMTAGFKSSNTLCGDVYGISRIGEVMLSSLKLFLNRE